MKSTGIVVALVIVAVVCSIVAVNAEDFFPREKIIITANLSITGNAHDFGTQLRDGMQHAIDEINLHGGINGKDLELVVADNESNNEVAKEKFIELEETYKPLFHITALSGVSIAVAPLAEEENVVLISLAATAPDVTVDKDWTYRYYPTANSELIPIVNTIDNLEIKKLGILYQDDPFGSSVTDAIVENYAGTDMKIIKSTFATNETTHEEYVNQVTDTEAIAIIAWTEHSEGILKDIEKVGYKGNIIAVSDAAIPSIVTMPQAEGMYLATPIIYNQQFLFAQQVAEGFESKYGKEFDHMAGNGYDIITILEGLLEDEELTRENVKNILDRGFSYSGVFGSVDMSPGSHDIEFPLVTTKVVDGKMEYTR